MNCKQKKIYIIHSFILQVQIQINKLNYNMRFINIRNFIDTFITL
jgi:hypothetical protein